MTATAAPCWVSALAGSAQFRWVSALAGSAQSGVPDFPPFPPLPGYDHLASPLEAALSYLYDHGAHFVLLKGGLAREGEEPKSPAWKGYQSPRNRPSLDDVYGHLAQGGGLGLIPWSVKTVGRSRLAVTDLDGGDRAVLAQLRQLAPPLHVTPTAKPGRWHYYYDTSFEWSQLNGLTLATSLGDVPADVRCGKSGYVVLYDPIGLAHALALPRAVGKGKNRRVVRYPFPAGLVKAAIQVQQEARRQRQAEAAPPPIRAGWKSRARAAARAKAQARQSRRGPRTARERPSGCPAVLYATETGLRNDTLNRELYRNFMYRARDKGRDGAEETWRNWVRWTALEWNQAFPEPLPAAEAEKVARSVAEALWEKRQAPAFLRDTSSATQRRRQRQGVQVRRERHYLDQRDDRVRELRGAGETQAAIAEAMGISRRRVGQILAQGPEAGEGNLPSTPPRGKGLEKPEKMDGFRNTRPPARRDENRNPSNGKSSPDDEIRRASRLGKARAQGRPPPVGSVARDRRYFCSENLWRPHAWERSETEIGGKAVAVEVCRLCGWQRFADSWTVDDG